ncbi:hypothetical protein [Mammaliicoccus lentus]|uniref:hypothetical protein n=1 Tax=Mammaliicoccus lentus TaxID=42858 RepID=UPI002DB79420|nr:hypothetical protein [Mammaliicoccus lentus]MEB8093155.1 hypothetical protein [Mammaliicoccus lentus]
MPTIKHTRESIAELEQEREQFKQQRDSLIKDVEKLREEKEYQTNQKFEHFLDNLKLQQENKALRLQADEYFNLWQDVDIKYTNLTEHIKDKALHNPSVSRYIDLVHVIDELERDTHEGN